MRTARTFEPDFRGAPRGAAPSGQLSFSQFTWSLLLIMAFRKGWGHSLDAPYCAAIFWRSAVVALGTVGGIDDNKHRARSRAAFRCPGVFGSVHQHIQLDAETVIQLRLERIVAGRFDARLALLRVESSPTARATASR